MDTLSNLLRQSSLDDNEQILKAANHTLKADASNTEAQHAKVVALLKLDRYDDALQAFEDAGETLKNTARLEWAYTLYRTNRLEEAEQVAKSDNTKRSLKHVSAQVAYRAENFALAGDIYDGLIRQGAGDESSDLGINSSANDAQLGWAGQAHLARKTKRDREDMEHFETAFNAACRCISREEMKQAELLLKMARDLCNAADELNEVERQAELLPILVQQLYVAIALGKDAEATQIANSIKVAAITDHTMQRIAHLNITLATCHNSYLLQRGMQEWRDMVSKDQPFTYQAITNYYNDLAIDFELEKYQTVRYSTKQVLSNKEGDRTSEKTIAAGIFNAAARGLIGISDRGARDLLEERPLDIGLVLLSVQNYITMDNTTAAVDTLESLFDRLEASSTPAHIAARFSPGLIALLVTLYTRQGRTEDIQDELIEAATYYRSNSSGADLTPSLLTAIGMALLDEPDSSDLELANELFTTYHSSHPDSAIAIAGLAASATSTTSVSTKFLGTLPSIAELTTGIDAAALESLGVARMPTSPASSSTSSKRTAPSSASPKLHPAKKHETGKLPKEHGEQKQPDPERWTPVRDRTNFRPKGKKKVGGGGRSQGGYGAGASPGGYQGGDEGGGPGTPAQVAGTVVSGKGRKGRKR